MSSPHAAGVAAMLYEKYPGILQKHVKYIITSISKNSISKKFRGKKTLKKQT